MGIGLINIKRLKKSFADAWHGVVYVHKHEQNFKLQLLFGIGVIILMLILRLRKSEMIVLLMLILMVLAAELLNSALEKFLDILKPRMELQVALVKDIMAAMVLLASVGSTVIGAIIFWPYIINLF